MTSQQLSGAPENRRMDPQTTSHTYTKTCLPRIIDVSVRYTRSIMNVSRARFTHSRQNGTLAESRSEEGSLTGSLSQPDTWRIPHSSPPFQPGTHTDRAITARGEGPRPAVFRPICCVSVQGRDGWGGGGRPLEGFASNRTRAMIKKRAYCSPRDNAVDN